MADRGYAVLLTYLHQPTRSTPALPTIQGLIAHYLAAVKPYPTPLAAAIVSSPLFLPFSHTKLQALSTSFRHAVHTKAQTLRAEASGVFSPSLSTQLEDWSAAVMKGLEGGHAITRLTCCGGLLLGLDDISSRLPTNQHHVKAGVEDELILTFADVIDVFSSPGGWEKEFQPSTEDGEDAMSLSMVIASQSLLLVPPEKFVALPLSLLLSLVVCTIDRAFRSGSFLENLQSSMHQHPDYKVFIPNTAAINVSIDSVSSSPVMSSMGSLAKLCDRALSLFIGHRPDLAVPQTADIFSVFEQLSARVEADWANSALSGITSEASVAPQNQDLTTSIWTILKTLLFTAIRITEAGLSAVVFVPPSHVSHPPRGSAKVSPDASPSTLALSTLRTLFHLSFVISQFGGAGQGAFVELKKAFFLALDVLATNSPESEQFVRDLWHSCEAFPSDDAPFYQAKKAFALAAIEQLIPVLSAQCIQDLIFPLCLPHLCDPTHRETYESAHSVVLAIFASHAQKTSQGILPPPRTELVDDREEGRLNSEPQGKGFVDTIVPFYAGCLIENSEEGKLSTPQLRLAFAALVRSASISGGHALAWFCIDALLAAVRSLALSPSQDTDRLHRLHLALISSLSSLPLPLLSRALDSVQAAVQSSPLDGGRRQELVDALFVEIMERVGDREKEYAMQWWSEQRLKWENTKVDGGASARGYEIGKEAGLRFWRRWQDKVSASQAADVEGARPRLSDCALGFADGQLLDHQHGPG